MKTVLLITSERLSLQRFESRLRALRADWDVYFLDENKDSLMVDTRPWCVGFLVSDDIAEDYGDDELTRYGFVPGCVFVCAVDYRTAESLLAVLSVLLPELESAWVDNDAGVVLLADEFVRRMSGDGGATLLS